MTVQDKQTHVADAVARLPNQFVDSDNLINLISTNAGRFQDLNDELIKLLDQRAISTSTGKQLDNLATILDLTREVGESDVSFRARFLAETTILARSGEIANVMDLYLLLTSATEIVYDEIYPAGFQIVAHVASDAEDAEEDTAVIDAMNDVKAGGVDMVLIISTEIEYFMLDSSANVDGSGNGTSSAEHGFGWSTEVDGGQLSRSLK